MLTAPKTAHSWRRRDAFTTLQEQSVDPLALIKWVCPSELSKVRHVTAPTKTSLARGGLPTAEPSWEQGMDRPTDAHSRPLLCVYLVVPKILCSRADLQSCNVLRLPAHQWDSLHPWLSPLPAARLVELTVVVVKTGWGCQSGSFPSCLTWTSVSSLHLMVRMHSWLHGWHPSETSNSPSLLPGGVSPLCPSPSSNTVLLKP